MDVCLSDIRRCIESIQSCLSVAALCQFPVHCLCLSLAREMQKELKSGALWMSELCDNTAERRGVGRSGVGLLPMVLCPMSVSLLRYLLVGECFYDWGSAGCWY